MNATTSESTISRGDCFACFSLLLLTAAVPLVSRAQVDSSTTNSCRSKPIRLRPSQPCSQRSDLRKRVSAHANLELPHADDHDPARLSLVLCQVFRPEQPVHQRLKPTRRCRWICIPAFGYGRARNCMLDILTFQGFGLNNTLGIDDFPNGEAYKIGTHAPRAAWRACFIRQTVGLGGDKEDVVEDPLTLAGKQDISRLTFTIGRFSCQGHFRQQCLRQRSAHAIHELGIHRQRYLGLPGGRLGLHDRRGR